MIQCLTPNFKEKIINCAHKENEKTLWLGNMTENISQEQIILRKKKAPRTRIVKKKYKIR